MQTTLLGLAIAMILALVTALVGPLYVDWAQYRSRFEAEASRIAGQPVRIGGPIDVRLLPVPSVVLREIEVGARAAPVFGARSLRAELALGALMKGELRAASLRLEGFDFSVGLNASGKIDVTARALGFDADQVSIDQLVVVDGRIALDDAASGAHGVLEKFSFSGDVRSLNGPIKGEGGFVSDHQAYTYRITVGRRADNAMRVRLNLDPSDRPLAIETEGNLSVEHNSPRYEGSLTMARPVGFALSSGKTVASEPWRIAGKVRADVNGALIEQIDIHYGPEERGVRLGGTADLRFGAKPRLTGIVSARQIDLDRVLASSDAHSRLPLAALRGLTENFGDLWRPPLPLSIGIGVDSVTLGGATLQAVRGDIKTTDDSWSVETFEFRAPGYTQVKLSGRVDGTQSAAQFTGPVSIDSSDPKALLTWLEGADPSHSTLGALRVRGDVTLGRERMAIERVNAEFDGKAFEGRLAYAFATAAHPARLDAALSAAEFDLDSAIAFAGTALAGANLDRPGEIALAIDVGRTTFLGLEAKSANANLKLDAAGLRIERLSVTDFGGAALTANGEIDVSATPPRGSVAMTIDAQKLDGIAALLAKVAPGTADLLRRSSASFAPAKIDATIRVEPAAANASARNVAKLSATGTIGALHLNLSADGTGDISAAANAEIRVEARLGSDAGALMAALGLDVVLGQDKRPASLTFAANGPAGGDLRVEAKLAREGFEAGATGTLRLRDADTTGRLDLSVAAADLRGLRRDIAFPVALKARATIANGAIVFDDLAGKAGASPVRGRLAVAPGRLPRVDGKIDVDALDLPALIATATGMPVATRAATWSPQPFNARPFADLSGRIEVDAAQAALTPGLMARKLHAFVDFTPSEVTFDDVTGDVAGGNLTGQAVFRRIAGGLSARAKIAVANADAAVLIRSANQSPIAGRVSSRVEVEGSGASPATLLGALRGTGTVTLQNAQLSGLETKAIDVAIRAVERGMPIAADRLIEIAGRVLDTGALSVSWMSAPIEVSAGRARLGKLVTPPQINDLAITASLDLVEETLDARFTLLGAAVPDAPLGQRPEISVALKGPVGAPKRTIDVSTLVGWLTLQSVDREAKKLEAAEQAAKRYEAARRYEMESQPRPAAPVMPASPPAATSTQPQLAPSLPPPISIAPLPAPDRRVPAAPRAESIPRAEPAPSPARPLRILPPPP